MSQRPHADVSVRVAWADDADAIAAVQLASWREQYAEVLPRGALPDAPAPVARAWRGSLSRPTDARNRALVALAHDRVVGFAATTPAGDPDCDPVADGELVELVVDPVAVGRGHGSRLLQAAVETMQADRFTRAVTWAIAADDARRSFLLGAGWEADSAHRELDLDGTGTTTLKQVRLHTAIG